MACPSSRHQVLQRLPCRPFPRGNRIIPTFSRTLEYKAPRRKGRVHASPRAPVPLDAPRPTHGTTFTTSHVGSALASGVMVATSLWLPPVATALMRMGSAALFL